MADSTKMRIAALATPNASVCLSEDDVVAFAMGRLDVRRVSQVHEHLDRCEFCQLLVSEGVRGLANAATAWPDSDGANPGAADTELDIRGSKTTFQEGSLVGGRYRIRRFIIDGGMGEVYEAFDCELQERVALKTVKSTISDQPRAVRWLKGEVQLARCVSHPNVCRIYDFGTHTMPETGVVVSFLTMEFVEGETLGLRVRLGGALPVAEARALARRLLLGLSAAHEAGVLHRDFKSDNVMLRDAGGGRTTPVILDFGLARRLHGQGKSSASALVGTFGYIAPEQIQGKPHTMASDVYSFGVVWYEMLTGELPFGDDGCAVEGLRSPSSINPLVPRELDAVVLKCIRRAPKERFKNAEDVLRALEAIRPSRFGVSGVLAIAAGAALCTFAIYFSVFNRAQGVKVRVAALLPALPRASAAPSAPLPPVAALMPELIPALPRAKSVAGKLAHTSPAGTSIATPNSPAASAKPAHAVSADAKAQPAAAGSSTGPPTSEKRKPDAPEWEPLSP
jgi:Protein kinase domain